MSSTISGGHQLGHYRVLEPLGAGAMGEVFRARDTRLNRDVAIKLLPAELAASPSRLGRLEREARAVAALSHPNIVTLHSVEKDGDHTFLTMELVEGESLGEIVPRDSGLPLERLFSLGIQLADAVAAAHERGVVHRDLKPANVMVGPKDRLKVLDFGLAKLTEPAGGAPVTATDSPTMTEEGVVLGTAPYMAPEQVRGEPVDGRCDVFALGAILFELATGRQAFEGETFSEVVSSVLRDTPPAVDSLRPEVPPHLAWVIRRCLEKDPDRRIQTSKDVRNELQDLRRVLREGSMASGSSTGASGRVPVARRTFVLEARHVRRLSERLPRLLGYPMQYLDNENDSATLVVCLHGAGLDHQQFEGVLRGTRVRAAAPSLVGFEPDADWRPALGFDDHQRLLRDFLRNLVDRLRPRQTVLLGFSSGADQLLRLTASEEGPGIEVAGLLALGPNSSVESCFVSSRYAKLVNETPASTLALLKSLGANIESLEGWLTLQEYITRALGKFGSDLEPLSRFASGIPRPFELDADALAVWYRTVMERVPSVRLVFAEPEATGAEELLSRHLEDNLLGDGFSQETFVLQAGHHMDLAAPELILRYLSEVVAELPS